MNNYFLLEALKEAKRGRGACAPNPAVGAVLVKAGEIMARGYHHAPGLPHAEVDLLSQVSREDTRGATVYVTLEPCCTWGRTPPCSEYLLGFPLEKVVYGYQDPNPAVDGGGAQQLRDNRLSCEHQSLPEIDAFYQSYAYWHQHQKPWVTAKLAISRDNKIALADGQPCAITGDAVRKFTHIQRGFSDALLTTAKTILMDDPQLNARMPTGTTSKKLYVLDRELKTPLTARIWETTAELIFFHQEGAEKTEAFLEKGARCVSMPVDSQNQFLWPPILAFIGEQGCHDLWVEAGTTCFSNLLQGDHLQRAIVFQAEKTLGPDAYPGLPNLEDFLAEAKPLLGEWGVDRGFEKTLL